MTRHRRVHGAWNYLRVRGEYLSSTPTASSQLELPPRARRIPGSLIRSKVETGTTSACAENTIGVNLPIGSYWNYLRVRGEYPDTSPGAPIPPELPPRARRIRR